MSDEEPAVPDLGSLLSRLGEVQQNLQEAQESAAAKVLIGSAGGGAVRDCIKTHLKEFSPGCQAAFTRVATAAKACATDTKQNCAGVKPGGSRIEVCLKAHFNALSADCKAALSGTAAGHT